MLININTLNNVDIWNRVIVDILKHSYLYSLCNEQMSNYNLFIFEYVLQWIFLKTVVHISSQKQLFLLKFVSFLVCNLSIN